MSYSPNPQSVFSLCLFRLQNPTVMSLLTLLKDWLNCAV